MKVRTKGPPAGSLLKGRKLIKKGRKVKYQSRSRKGAKLIVPAPFDLDQLAREFEHNEDHIVLSKVEKLDDWGFGGRISRTVEVMDPPRYGADTHYFRHWNELMGPTTPYEAWQMALKWKMELQGIEIHIGECLYQLFVDTTGHPTFRANDEDAMPSIEHILMSEEILSEPALLQLETPMLQSPMVRFLHALEYLGYHESPEGWTVAHVHRDLEAQADLFDMTVDQLRERLERRLKASRRGR